MDKIREILRLSQELNLGCRKIAAAFSTYKIILRIIYKILPPPF